MHGNSEKKKLHKRAQSEARFGGKLARGRQNARDPLKSRSSSRSLEHAASLTLDGALAPQHHAEKIAPIRHG
jgi:hypothetical protein